MKNIGIIGYGNMGEALSSGLVKNNKNLKIFVSEKKTERIEKAKKNGFSVIDKKELVTSSDIIIIAVKPQELETLVEEISSYTKKKRIISIVAGRKINYFEKNLNTDQVTRFMPNLAAMEGKALTGISYSKGAESDFKKECQIIANALGAPCELPESLMPAVTGLSGSGIAFVFAFIHAMALGGVASGITYQKSIEISLETIKGAIAVMEKTSENPVSLLSNVISPAGTTIKGISALEEKGFTFAVMSAIENATTRAFELER